MRISDNERKILAAIQLHADLSCSDAAKLSGVKEHTIRYVLRRLESQGIISRKTYINVYALGYCYYSMFFSLEGHTKAQIQKLLKFLIESPQISYVAETGGEFRYQISICARDGLDISLLLESMSEKFGSILRDKALSMMLSMSDFPMKFLQETPNKGEFLRVGIGAKRATIDELDHKILCLLSNEVNASPEHLSRKLKVPNSTIAYRLNGLKKQEVIVGSRYLINTNYLQMQSFHYLLYAKGLAAQLRKELFNFCAQHPNVYYLIECVGSWDFEVGLVVEQIQQILDFGESLQEKFGGRLARIVTLPLFQYCKVSSYPISSFHT